MEKQTHIGVGYKALAAASQVVAGVNYAILTTAKVMHHEAEPYNVIMTLYRDLEGTYHKTGIERVHIL